MYIDNIQKLIRSIVVYLTEMYKEHAWYKVKVNKARNS